MTCATPAPSSSTTSSAETNVLSCPGSPLTVTRPATMSSSALRLEATPARARYAFSRIALFSRAVKLWLVAAIAIAAAGVFAGLYFTKDAEPEAAAAPPCGDRVFGHIRSLVPKDGRYELRFDPALWLSGETANAAAAEDGAVPLGEPVPNDYYIVDESHRLLTYHVGPNAHVTVLTGDGYPPLAATSISVAELAKIVNGTSRLDPFESLDSGVWIRTRIDTVCALDQQYRP